MKDVRPVQGHIEILFPISSQFVGKDTLIVTETSRNQRQCPTVYGSFELNVLPTSADVMCMF
ncbi:hypothetical protein K493DRAFT_312254 [Basidiobolus meristosporus CBS 931.73]|uniref:Uncharacterized protein n=1 Tax=Basidiobolus meristosporus CBS 931.73 TaxID=1314790 RepID=A0A1Y1YV39_9FUNG|nr:hypothetical protein K493DRAFT_312254 [Basidiobolus meristosporus CBS 931.73]|eukprot:ORY01861.1 hypothetical protein K493DRAFT_312254 [Basidiobolus meristosporus CBS 931.73]